MGNAFMPKDRGGENKARRRDYDIADIVDVVSPDIRAKSREIFAPRRRAFRCVLLLARKLRHKSRDDDLVPERARVLEFVGLFTEHRVNVDFLSLSPFPSFRPSLLVSRLTLFYSAAVLYRKTIAT